jgi:hypothetical protein
MKRGHDVESAPGIWRRRTASEHYAGIDVSLELSSVCIVDAQDKIVREAKVASEPEALVAYLRRLVLRNSRLGNVLRPAAERRALLLLNVKSYPQRKRELSRLIREVAA